MYIIHVHVRVKSEYVKAFKRPSKINAKQSELEPGITGFDVIQQIDDTTRFVFVEVYRTIEDTTRHKETGHYEPR